MVVHVYQPLSRFGRVDLEDGDCVASVHDDGGSVGFHRCTRKGTKREEGYNWCWQHAPSAVAERDRKWEEKYQRDREIRRKASDRSAAHYEIGEVARKVFRQEATFDELEKTVLHYEKLLRGEEE